MVVPPFREKSQLATPIELNPLSIRIADILQKRMEHCDCTGFKRSGNGAVRTDTASAMGRLAKGHSARQGCSIINALYFCRSVDG
jgi:hypothetical protein